MGTNGGHLVIVFVYALLCPTDISTQMYTEHVVLHVLIEDHVMTNFDETSFLNYRCKYRAVPSYWQVLYKVKEKKKVNQTSIDPIIPESKVDKESGHLLWAFCLSFKISLLIRFLAR